MHQSGVAVLALALLLAVGIVAVAGTTPPAPAQAHDVEDVHVNIDLRIWQRADNPDRLYLSGRVAGGAWGTLGTVRLVAEALAPNPGDEGASASLRRYRIVTLWAPLRAEGVEGPSARIEVRVERDTRFLASATVHIRGEGYTWSEAERVVLPLVRLHPNGYRFGDLLRELPLHLPAEEHLDLKHLMLGLINEARAGYGRAPLALGSNDAAQLHADALLEGCALSHWGLDGLKPYMRHTLVGGVGANAENVSGLSYCITAADGYRAIRSLEDEVRESMEGFLASPGHRRAILGRWHTHVNIGLAWDGYNFRAVQHFEGNYVDWEQPPTIVDGVLSLAGRTFNGAGFGESSHPSVQVYFDPPPGPLTAGQLARTNSYGSGPLVASLRRPLPPNWFYRTEAFAWTYQSCSLPTDFPADAPAPRSPDESRTLHTEARARCANADVLDLTVPWITATEWSASGDAFSLSADLASVIAEHGAGVYTVLVWAPIEGTGARAPISQISIFHEVEPPEGYWQHR